MYVIMLTVHEVCIKTMEYVLIQSQYHILNPSTRVYYTLMACPSVLIFWNSNIMCMLFGLLALNQEKCLQLIGVNKIVIILICTLYKIHMHYTYVCK